MVTSTALQDHCRIKVCLSRNLLYIEYCVTSLHIISTVSNFIIRSSGPVHLWTGRMPWRDWGLRTAGVVSKPEQQPYWIIPSVLLQPERPRPSGPQESFKTKLQQNGADQCGVAAGRYTAVCCYHCCGCLFLLLATSERVWKIGRLNNITAADSLSTESSETKKLVFIMISLRLERDFFQRWTKPVKVAF